MRLKEGECRPTVNRIRTNSGTVCSQHSAPSLLPSKVSSHKVRSQLLTMSEGCLKVGFNPRWGVHQSPLTGLFGPQKGQFSPRFPLGKGHFVVTNSSHYFYRGGFWTPESSSAGHVVATSPGSVHSQRSCPAFPRGTFALAVLPGHPPRGKTSRTAWHRRLRSDLPRAR